MRFPLWEPQQSISSQDHTQVTMPDQVPDSAMRTETGKAIHSHRHDFTDIAAQVIMIPIEALLDHDIGIIATITGVTDELHFHIQ